MKRIATPILLALLFAFSPGTAASDARSLDDNPWLYLKLDLPMSWTLARWEANRVNHVLDILEALDDCTCKKAKAILEDDLRGYQRDLEQEMDKLTMAEAKGEMLLDATGQEQQARLAATDAQARATRYWASGRSRSDANQSN